MARPQKQTVDYFPHDSHASDGKTLYVLEAKYKNDGYAFWFKLLELLASSKGHVFDASDPAAWQFLQAKTGIHDVDAENIMSLLCDLHAVDSSLWRHRIIWVQNLVDNVKDVYQNRKLKVPEKPISTDNNPVSTVDNLVNPCNLQEKGTQRGGEGIKGEGIKGDRTIYTVFTFWNSLNLTNHKELSAKRISAIKARLDGGYTADELMGAIKTYSEIVNDDGMLLKQKWTIEEFMSPTRIDKFMSPESARQFYFRGSKNNSGGNSGTNRESTGRRDIGAPLKDYGCQC